MRGSYFCAQPELAYASKSQAGDFEKKRNHDASNTAKQFNGNGNDLSMFFRATYASAPFDRILEGIGRFGDAVREEFELLD